MGPNSFPSHDYVLLKESHEQAWEGYSDVIHDIIPQVDERSFKFGIHWFMCVATGFLVHGDAEIHPHTVETFRMMCSAHDAGERKEN